MSEEKNIHTKKWIKEFLLWLALGVLAGPIVYFISLAYDTYTPDLFPHFLETFFVFTLGLPLVLSFVVGGSLGWLFCEPAGVHTFGCAAEASRYFVIPFYIIYLPFLYWIYEKVRKIIKKHKKE